MMMMMMEWEIQKLVKNIFVGGKQIVNQCTASNHQKILTFLKAAIRKDGIKSIFHFFSIHEVFSEKKHKTFSFNISNFRACAQWKCWENTSKFAKFLE